VAAEAAREWADGQGGGRVLGMPSTGTPDPIPPTPPPRRAAQSPDLFAYFMRGWDFDEGGGRVRATPPPPTTPPRRDTDTNDVSPEAKPGGDDGPVGEAPAPSLEGESGAMVELIKPEMDASAGAPEIPAVGLTEEATGQQGGGDGGLDLDEGEGASSFPPASGPDTSAGGAPMPFREESEEPQAGDEASEEAPERETDGHEVAVREICALDAGIFRDDMNTSESEEDEEVLPPIPKGPEPVVAVKKELLEQGGSGGGLDLEGEGASTISLASGLDTSTGGAPTSFTEEPKELQGGEKISDKAPERAAEESEVAVREVRAITSATFCDDPNMSEEEEEMMPPIAEGTDSAVGLEEKTRQQAEDGGGLDLEGEGASTIPRASGSDTLADGLLTSSGAASKETQPTDDIPVERVTDHWGQEVVVSRRGAPSSPTPRGSGVDSSSGETPQDGEGPEPATQLEEEAVGQRDEQQEVVVPRRTVSLSSTPGASGFDTSSAETPRGDEDPPTRLVELADALRRELELVLQQRGASASAGFRALDVKVSVGKVPACRPEKVRKPRARCERSEEVPHASEVGTPSGETPRGGDGPEPVTKLLEEVVGQEGEEQEVLVRRRSASASASSRASSVDTSAEATLACSPEEPETRPVVIAGATRQTLKLTVQRRRVLVSTRSRASRVDRSGGDTPECCPGEPKKPKARRVKSEEEKKQALAAYELRVQQMCASVSRSDPDSAQTPRAPAAEITLGETGRTGGGSELRAEVKLGGAPATPRSLEVSASAAEVPKLSQEPSLSALNTQKEAAGHTGGGAGVSVEVQREGAVAVESPRTAAEQSPSVKMAPSVSGAGTALRDSAAVTIADGGAVSVKGVEACEKVGQPGGGQAVPSSVSVDGTESATSLDDPTSPVAASSVAPVSPKPLVTEEPPTRGAPTTTPATSSHGAAVQEAAVTKSPGRAASSLTSRTAAKPANATESVREDQTKPKAKVSCLASLCKWSRARLQLTRYECTLKWRRGTVPSCRTDQRHCFLSSQDPRFGAASHHPRAQPLHPQASGPPQSPTKAPAGPRPALHARGVEADPALRAAGVEVDSSPWW
jgi:hypothetical protein